MTIQMFDSITVNAVPGNPQAVAGYVGGWWPTYLQLVARFPGAHHLSIATNAREDAECLDVESGDAVPSQAPAWVIRQRNRGVTRPVLYCSVSAMPAVLEALSNAGIPRSDVRLWSAHYTFSAHLCSEVCGGLNVVADATQWTDGALGRNLDESLCSDAFFGPPPPPPDPNHYERYPEGPFARVDPATGRTEQLNERAVVMEYDHRRVHPRIQVQRLDQLRADVVFLRKRVWYVAHFDSATGTKRPQPDWASYWRGWRWQMLLARSRGEKVTGTAE